MAKPPQRAPDDAQAILFIAVPGWLKNAVAEVAAAEGVSITTFVGVHMREVVREGRGLPPTPPAAAPLPTPAEAIHAYLKGEQMLMPCGKPGKCEGFEAKRVVLGTAEFCSVCDVRLT